MLNKKILIVLLLLSYDSLADEIDINNTIWQNPVSDRINFEYNKQSNYSNTTIRSVENNEANNIQKTDNQKQIEHTINYLIIHKQWQNLAKIIDEYSQIDNHDKVLIDFSLAKIFRAAKKYPESFGYYEAILENHPDYTFVRLDYAQALFENKQYQEAKIQFNRLNKDEMLPITAKSVENYLSAIDKAQQNKIDLMINYENNNNINQVSDAKTLTIDGKIYQKSQNSLPISDEGLRYHTSIERVNNVGNNHNIVSSGYVSGVHYFNHNQYNEQNLEFGLGYRHQNANALLEVMPMAYYSNYDGSDYNRGYGIKLNAQYDVNDKWQARFYHNTQDLNYEDYADLDGIRNYTQINLLNYSNNYYFIYGIFYSDENLVNKAYQSKRLGGSIGVEYRKNDNLGIQLRYSIAQRQFAQAHELTGVLRRDYEHNYHLALFSPKISYKSWTPTLNISYRHTDSTMDDWYGYNNLRLFLSAYRRF